MRLLNWNWRCWPRASTPTAGAASVAKVFGTETHDLVCRTLLGAVGAMATRRPAHPRAAGRVGWRR